jgi:hypothetical protein
VNAAQPQRRIPLKIAIGETGQLPGALVEDAGQGFEGPHSHAGRQMVQHVFYDFSIDRRQHIVRLDETNTYVRPATNVKKKKNNSSLLQEGLSTKYTHVEKKRGRNINFE